MTTTSKETARVENYNLAASNGSHIRVATKVILPDGVEIKFTEKLSRRQALAQSLSVIRSKAKRLILSADIEKAMPGILMRPTKDMVLVIGIAASASGDSEVSTWANSCMSIIP